MAPGGKERSEERAVTELGGLGSLSVKNRGHAQAPSFMQGQGVLSRLKSP